MKERKKEGHCIVNALILLDNMERPFAFSIQVAV